jgi:hypothetical protein
MDTQGNVRQSFNNSLEHVSSMDARNPHQSSNPSHLGRQNGTKTRVSIGNQLQKK